MNHFPENVELCSQKKKKKIKITEQIIRHSDKYPKTVWFLSQKLVNTKSARRFTKNDKLLRIRQKNYFIKTKTKKKKNIIKRVHMRRTGETK